MIQDLKKIWFIFTPNERRKAVWILILVILMAIVEALGVVSIVPFLSVLGQPSIIHENQLMQRIYDFFSFDSDRAFIFALGLSSIAIVVSASSFKTVTLFVVNRFVHMQRHSISSRLLSSYLQQPYEYFLRHNSSHLAQNVLSEIDQFINELMQPLSQLFAQGAVLLAMTLLILFYNPLMAVWIIGTLALFYSVIYGLLKRQLRRIGEERKTANAQRYKSCNEALGGIKDVKVTHSASAYQNQFDEASRLFSRHMAASETMAQSPLYLVEATGYSGLIVIALLLLAKSNDIAHILPALGLYGFAAYRMLPAAQIMYRGFAKLKFSSASLSSIHQDLSLPRERLVNEVTRPLKLEKEIQLTGISYAYPSSPNQPVLNNFNLIIPANTTTGIVGRSGAGKSTLMDILLGLIQPHTGQFSVDGKPINAETIPSWHKTIGYVPQHIFLADASVAENIAFGVPKEEIDMQAVERSARIAQIHNVITSELPQGYHTPLGERGIRLSGGQRQRIGIARALYHDPLVLLMDEATSALDVETELNLNIALKGLSGQKTVVLIAHKKFSLEACSRVINLSAEQKHAI